MMVAAQIAVRDRGQRVSPKTAKKHPEPYHPPEGTVIPRNGSQFAIWDTGTAVDFGQTPERGSTL